ncbi:hypothetical protein NDU88_006861 [Pleurodeles waltl]|uniref:Uncharacterized protein n=1 Tax=Pleurodeles waltl TaxID=8319 RepID=A0AAV7PJM5_PLEWA|nr:hypothetical protein NDU88_006861 [Pleurodeles waltl]
MIVRVRWADCWYPETRGAQITCMSQLDGRQVHSQMDINDAFREYYTELYGSNPMGSRKILDAFLTPLALQESALITAEKLGDPITPLEIKGAIKR